jgi:Fe2+ transport system protein FeoA
MEELVLKNLPLGIKGYISRCLSPSRADVYRLLEMGLCRGAECVILRRGDRLKAMEIAIKGSRLCIADELAAEFMVTLKSEARK